MKIVFSLLAMMAVLYAGQYDKVKITPTISYVYVYHKGKAVKVHRIQDTKNKLTGEYAKVYRPGKYIQPITMDKDIPTIGEIEVIDFMRNKVNKKKGLIIDVRNRDQYAQESIPSAVNIPFKVANHEAAMSKIFRSLGMRKKPDGSWDGSKAMELVVYCNGLWCKKSSDFIRKLVEMGYPKEKIKYYRGGFQMWKILGFTTVKN
jgi:rhodanese-related sulfurtransferase